MIKNKNKKRVILTGKILRENVTVFYIDEYPWYTVNISKATILKGKISSGVYRLKEVVGATNIDFINV